MNHANSKKVNTIVASRPGIMREALHAALAGYPYLEVIGSAGDGLSALNMVRAQQPLLMIIDSNLLEDEIVALLQLVKQEWPAIRCLVLVQTSRQQQQLLAAGADAVLLRHEPIDQLGMILEELSSPDF